MAAILFDTDVLIWIQRGNKLAADYFEKADKRFISIQSYMELIQCAPSLRHVKTTKSFLFDFDVQVLPFTENIGHRAAIYVEEYSLSTGIRAGDALIAATAMENKLPLMTSNKKHFKSIHSLELKILEIK